MWAEISYRRNKIEQSLRVLVKILFGLSMGKGNYRNDRALPDNRKNLSNDINVLLSKGQSPCFLKN